MTALVRACANCRWSFAFEAKGTKKELHHCRLHAPTMSPVDGSSCWPMVMPEMVCGEHALREGSLAEAPHPQGCSCLFCLGRASNGRTPALWNGLGTQMRHAFARAYPKEAGRFQAMPLATKIDDPQELRK